MPIHDLDQEQLEKVCAWLNGLPVYMFTGALTRSLLRLAYLAPDLDKVDHNVRLVLNYQASLIEPLEAQAFVALVQECMTGQIPPKVRAFLEHDTLH